MTQIRVTKHANCPFSAAVELAEKAVHARKGMFVTPSAPFGERVRFTAATTGDRSDETRKHEALLIAWQPQASVFFPDFRGVVTVRPEQRGARLRFQGEYTPPYGTAGKVFDVVVGRTLARRTMHRFLDELSAEIEAAYAEERKHPQPV
jgi:hypothetical protein